jgi:hypothetical protein
MLVCPLTDGQFRRILLNQYICPDYWLWLTGGHKEQNEEIMNMRFVKMSFLMLAMLTTCWSAYATTRYVSPSGVSPYLTVMSAIQASAVGDTVLIGPGTYPESATLYSRVTIIGAGWDVTQIAAITIYGGSGAVVEGVSSGGGGYPLYVGAGLDSVTIRRCRLTDPITSGYPCVVHGGASALTTIEDCQIIQAHPSADLVDVTTGHVVYRNCLFVQVNAGTNIYAFNGINGNLEVYNCVFLGPNRLLNCTGTVPIVFINNIVYDWLGASPTYGTYLAGSMFAYNASDRIAPPGTNGITLATNPFVAYDSTANFSDASNLRMAGGSPCIHTGHPSILNMDGSRSDMGIYGGPRPIVTRGVPSYPFPISLTITPTLIGLGDSIQVNTSGRVGPRY